MRIRQIKPDFWRDGVVALMPDTTRLVYVGLWMEADDAGWLRLDVREIANDLYPYLALHVRERRVQRAVDELLAAGRIQPFPCGHALIPTFVRHQRFGGPDKRVVSVQKEHERESREAVEGPTDGIPAGNSGDPRGPAVTRPERGGTEGEGKYIGGVWGGVAATAASSNQEPTTKPSEFQRKVPRPRR